jgi:excinuclease ABC subunit A
MPAYQELQHDLEKHGPGLGIDLDKPWDMLSEQEKQLVITGKKSKGLYGIRDFFAWLEKKTYKMHIRVFLSRWRAYRPCETCGGKRLKPESLAVKLNQLNFANLSDLPLEQINDWLEQVKMQFSDHPAASRVIRPMENRLRYLMNVGLGYLNLARAARTLSGGEMQRVGLTTALGSGLVNMLFVLDEPTAGLHPADTSRLLNLVRSLRDRGNTVVAVEHDIDFINSCDDLIDLGPGAGEQGGNILFSGSLAALKSSDTNGSVTQPFLNGNSTGKSSKKLKTRPVDGDFIEITGCRGHYLKNIDVRIPVGAMTIIGGVSGSGKTTLLEKTIAPALAQLIGQDAERPEPFDEIKVNGNMPRESILVDASSIGRSSRSNPATFLKIMDEIRKVFAELPEAKSRKFNAGRFSFNNEQGRCSTCEGNGYQTVEMQFLADVMIKCPDCRGARFKPEVLEIQYRGKSIADILEMTGREAWSFFRTKTTVQTRLRWLMDVGLDYLRLGQSTSTLSGGEAQRLKLASHLSKAGEAGPGTTKSGQVVFMDEPTTGLHPADIETVLQAFDGLVDRGHTLVMVEHDLDLIRRADWLIELGPGAGHAGGDLLYMGRPEGLKGKNTPTAIALSEK